MPLLTRSLLLVLVAGSHSLRLGVPPPASAALAHSPAHPTMQAAPMIAKPKTKQRQKTGGPGGGGGGAAVEVAKPKLQRKNEDVPMWKLILLGDGDYEQDPVVSVLTQVCKDTVPNERAAVVIYEECMKTGRSLVGLHPKEIAEMYVEQLARADPEMIVYSEIEEDKSGKD